jgi:hypothetical protein
MFDSGGRPSDFLHACLDVTIAAVAGGLMILVFYPLTLCAAAVKGVLRPSRSRHGDNRESSRPAAQL